MIRKMILHAVVSIAIMLFVFVASPKAFAGDTDSARNYLSTIVSCLSTIFALSISITLVAIQLTATRYTHRVLDLFIKFPYNISLALFYLVTIIQSLFLLSRITDPIHQTLPSYLQPQMNADIVLVIMCFGILILYMISIMQMLKPERIIAAIEQEFLFAIRKGHERDALTKVEQICDIAKRAAVDLDSTTGMIALQTLHDIVTKGTKETRNSVTNQFIEIATIAAKEREAGMLNAVLSNLKELGKDALAQGRIQDARDVVHALERIVRTGLIGQQLFHFIEATVASLYGLAESALEIDRSTDYTDYILFAQRTFAAICAIGQEVVVRETAGCAYVGRAILADRFGSLCQAHLRHDQDKGREGTWRLIEEYLSLAKMMMEQAHLRDLAPVTLWLKEAQNAGDHLQEMGELLMLVVMLLASLASYTGRTDIEQFIFRVLHTHYALQTETLGMLLLRESLLQPLFDYIDVSVQLEKTLDNWRALCPTAG